MKLVICALSIIFAVSLASAQKETPFDVCVCIPVQADTGNWDVFQADLVGSAYVKSTDGSVKRTQKMVLGYGQCETTNRITSCHMRECEQLRRQFADRGICPDRFVF